MYLLTYIIPLTLGTLTWHLNHTLGITTTIITTILTLTAHTQRTRNRSTHKKNRNL